MEAVGTTAEAGERLLAAWRESVTPVGENLTVAYRSAVPYRAAADFAARLAPQKKAPPTVSPLPTPDTLLSSNVRRLSLWFSQLHAL